MQTKAFDPLWVPLITHYRSDDPSRLDAERTRRHLNAIEPDVRQYLIAGTTGDGWAMSDDLLDQWLDLAVSPDSLGGGQTFLVGALAADTAAVIDRARRIEQRLADRPPASRFAGLAICPPVDADASQQAITEHYRAVLAATSAPIAVYQLPQITGCEIAPETFAGLAAEHPRISLFKDTSGADRVAASGVATGDAKLLRGAEGDFARHLKPGGAYDGWLLSSANGFARELREIADDVAAGHLDRAVALSDSLTAVLGDLFAEASGLGGNAFADANRAVDHLHAWGTKWRTAPSPVRAGGDRLPVSFLDFTQARLRQSSLARQTGYLADQAHISSGERNHRSDV